MKGTTAQTSCDSTACPMTEDVHSTSVPSDEMYVPAPRQIEGPGSSAVASSCGKECSAAIRVPASVLTSLTATYGQEEKTDDVVCSTPATKAVDDSCTIVESVFTGQSVVPPPQTLPPVLPECGRWAGEAFAETICSKKSVELSQEQIVYKPVKQIIHRPVEKTTYIQKPIKKEVVEFRQVVTDEVIEVPKPYTVETKVFKPEYVDHQKACIVAQKYVPIIHRSENIVHYNGAREVECVKYEPEIRLVDVKIPKLVENQLIVQARDTKYRVVDNISKAQWNTLVFKLNPELCAVGDLTHLPVHRGPDGTVIAFKKDVAVGAPLA